MTDSIHALASLLVDVQAGGGGSFGGGGGGGGGGDGDGLFGIFYFLIRLAFEAPLIGVPLLVIAIAVVALGARKGKAKHQERVIRVQRPQLRSQDSRRLASRVQTADPAFDERSFLTRVETAFRTAQTSWCDQDLEQLRHFVTDGVFERFSLQIEEQRGDGWRQGMSGLEVGPVTLTHVDLGQHFETVTVQIGFRADIHRLNLETGKRIPGSQLPRNHFSECWSFVRRRGAKTIQENGLIEGQCPNCGAPLSVKQSARCETCEALVRSGEFDWVLAEITQSSEWRPETESELPGVARYLKLDPGISIQLVEDRCSVAFWRKVAAGRRGNCEPLVRLATPEFCESYSAQTTRGDERVYAAENAVGSVRTLGFLAGPEYDRAVVEVLSDGRRARVDSKGKRRLETSRHLRRELFVFKRRAGARTDLKETFTSSRCRACGAHDAGGTDPRCPYCEAPRTGDKSTWLLSDLLLDGSAEARALRQELQSESPVVEGAPLEVHLSSADLLSWATEMVKADGVLSPVERRALEQLARRNGLSSARIEELIERDPDPSVVPRPRDSYEARSWLRTLSELALADGSLQSGEKRFLKHAAKHLGVGAIELDRILSRARTNLYRRSKEARRAR